MTDTAKPEYSPEQVQHAIETATWLVNEPSPRSALEIHKDTLRIILSALAARQADSRRLDWLERTQHDAVHWMGDNGTSWTIESDATIISGAVGAGETLREAIDDGMTETAAREAR